jgi:nitrogen fixation/metabolism regulation signal transduction histidine kinase
MSGIQQKMLLLSGIVLMAMSAIWTVLTYFNQQTQEQYNQILQRYLRMNDVSNLSGQTVALLNDYMLAPDEGKLIAFHRAKERLLQARNGLEDLRTPENDITLTNYMNMIDSLSETADSVILFIKQINMEQSNNRFDETARISKYLSETTLDLMNIDLNTYDEFYRSMIEKSSALKQLGFFILGLSTLLLLLMAYWLSVSITRPIMKLTHAARELSRGRFDQRIEIESNDEISFLAKTFDRMRININNLISEIQHNAQLESELKENKLRLQESQLRSLQSQINPHFLFNTLDTLSKKAYLEGAEETSDLIASVANLLRYNLKRLDRSVTLREEIDVMMRYLEIQKARFTERLQFEIVVDEALLHIRIPSLTLQPIIENAVIHAVEPMEEGGTIRFRVHGDEERVHVEIADNGAGMSESVIRRILEEHAEVEPEGHSTGIGFSNVVRRLRLFYGEEDIIDIRSEQGQGTTVILRLPRHGGMKHDTQAADRG